MNARVSLSLARDVRAGVDRRAGLVLAVSVGVHMLALLLFWQAPAPAPRAPAATQVVSILLLPSAAPRPQPQPRLPPRAPAEPVHAATTLASARVRAAAHVAPAAAGVDVNGTRTTMPTIAAPDADATVSSPIMAAASAPAASTAAASTSAAESPASPVPTSTLAGGVAATIGRHQAGRIDRELRGGKSGVPLQADTPWARFGRAVEAAHIDRSMSVREDETTGPDGVIVYRFRQGNQTRCRRSGGVSIGITGASMGSINDAGWISCPSGAVWTPVD